MVLRDGAGNGVEIGEWVRRKERVDVQVDELAFVVLHGCRRFGGCGERSFVVASALIEAYICRRKGLVRGLA